MSKENLYVDVHVLQTVPPSCINRDDTGSPKTAIYGGVTRARVSSQAWKREIRIRFKDIFENDMLGCRTKKVAQLIASKIKEISDSESKMDDEKCFELALKALEMIGIKNKEGQSEVLLFFSMAQAKAIALLALEGCKEKKAYEKALKENPSVDMALFGRMVASDASLNCDAAAQVAHSISTHAIHNEYDYFTAVDDSQDENNAGAGHLGTVEFNSSTLYRYATVNVKELYKNLGDFSPEAVKGFMEAFVLTMPTGKQNTFANRTYPDFVYITIRKDQPVNLCGAFEMPISNRDGGYLVKSEKALLDYADKIYTNYAVAPLQIWGLGELFSDQKTFPQILDELESVVREKMSGNEVE